ncbi:AAA family ATPase, partial [Myxococcota bacterium]|nr:AAA family ATPase [Myxococcota bacterium]MBU1537447.1 AAA family ATPase [Myxococcota bacterium]
MASPSSSHPEFCGALSGAILPAGDSNVFSWFSTLRMSELVGFDLPLGILGFYWELVRDRDLSPRDKRLLHLFFLSFHLIKERGSTRVSLLGPGSIEALLSTIPPGNIPYTASETLDRFQDLLGSGKLEDLVATVDDVVFETVETQIAPFILTRGFLQDLRTLAQEVALLRDLQTLMDAAALGNIELTEAQSSFLTPAGKRVPLDESQIAAVKMAGNGRFTVISGGPGTGKTSVILSILRVYQQIHGDSFMFALAAPTGKAAYRMCSSVLSALPKKRSAQNQALADRVIPFTLHRLLEYHFQRSSFGKGRNNPLLQHLIIVDEASMVELSLMARLLSALGDNTSLVLTGDAHQLPSVGTGAVLRDLVTAQSAHVKILKTNHRSDKRISSAAQCIKDGDSFSLVVNHITPAQHVDFSLQGLWQVSLDTPERLGAFLESWASSEHSLTGLWDRFRGIHLDPSEGFASHHELLAQAFSLLSNSALLCATNELDRGTHEINTWFHRQHPDFYGRRPADPLEGEPVIVLTNDYRYRLFNGDMGIVVTIREGS